MTVQLHPKLIFHRATPLYSPQHTPQQAPVAGHTTGFINTARYGQALGVGVGGAWWDLLDNYHQTNGYYIYDYPD